MRNFRDVNLSCHENIMRLKLHVLKQEMRAFFRGPFAPASQ